MQIVAPGRADCAKVPPDEHLGFLSHLASKIFPFNSQHIETRLKPIRPGYKSKTSVLSDEEERVKPTALVRTERDRGGSAIMAQMVEMMPASEMLKNR